MRRCRQFSRRNTLVWIKYPDRFSATCVDQKNASARLIFTHGGTRDLNSEHLYLASRFDADISQSGKNALILTKALRSIISEEGNPSTCGECAQVPEITFAIRIQTGLKV